MAVSLNESLSALAKFNREQEIAQLFPPLTNQTIAEIRIRFLEINSELSSIFLHSGQSEEILESLKENLREIILKNNVTHLLQKIDDQQPEKENLKKVIDQFQILISRFAYTPIEKNTSSPFCPYPSLLLSSRLRLSNILFPIKKNDADFSLLTNEELIEKFVLFNNTDDLTKAAALLNPKQVYALITSKKCNCKIPRILTSLPHPVFFEFLLAIDDPQATAINRHLTSVRSEPWFTEHFKQIREDFVNLSNKKAKKIDKFNRSLRKMAFHEFSREIIQQIEDLKHETQLAWEAQKRLQLLIHNIITDQETLHLFNNELPPRYTGLIHRLSDKEVEQKMVSGCPYGIIYRISFMDYEDPSQSTSTMKPEEIESDLVSIICNWNMAEWTDWITAGIIDAPDAETGWNGISPFKQGVQNLKKWQIESIDDLKRLRIFNDSMLKEYIELKKIQEAVDDQNLNPLQRLTQRLWRT